MLKQLFNSEQILKAFSNKDIWRWDVLNVYGNAENAATSVVHEWKNNGYKISPLKTKVIKGKTVFTTAELKDHLAVKLVDRYLRRIYKVRQSDRNRVVRQVITLMEDTSDLSFIKIDIKNCFESINFRNLLENLKSDMILAPSCIAVLEDIAKQTELSGELGLPRGLSISTTLAELYLEKLDKKLAKNINVIYMTRYVDDIMLVIPRDYCSYIYKDIDAALSELELARNIEKSNIYSANPINQGLEFLGYLMFSQNKPNSVDVKIATNKIKKIKTRIALSFLEYKKDPNFKLLKDRLYFLSALRVVKKNNNGTILAGNAYNYMYATDFSDLKNIDGFYFSLIDKNRYGLTSTEKNELKKISFYHIAKNKRVMKLTRKEAFTIKGAWINAE